MEKGLGDLGFWLAVGAVITAIIVAGALKERAKDREKQATLRALLDMKSDNAAEVLAYLRERDAAEAAHRDFLLNRKRRMTPRQEMAFAGAFMVGVFSFLIGFMMLIPHAQLQPLRLVYSAEAHRMIPAPPPPPPPLWEQYLPLGIALGIWAAGLIIAVLFLAWGGFGKPKHDAQPDA